MTTAARKSIIAWIVASADEEQVSAKIIFTAR